MYRAEIYTHTRTNDKFKKKFLKIAPKHAETYNIKTYTDEKTPPSVQISSAHCYIKQLYRADRD